MIGYRDETNGLDTEVDFVPYILINGDHASRLGKRICKRHGSKLVTLLSGEELYSSGERVKPLESPWVSTFLRTHHRETYIQSRDDRRCHMHDCFVNGIPLTLKGASTKRCQRHIDEALLFITHPTLAIIDDDPPPLCQPTPAVSAPDSRRPIRTSGGSNVSGKSSVEGAVLMSDQMRATACQQDVSPLLAGLRYLL